METAKSIWNSISDSWKNDVINGDAKSRSEWFGRAVGEAALAIIGTKGVDKAVKVAKGARVVKEGGGVRVVRPETIEKKDGGDRDGKRVAPERKYSGDRVEKREIPRIIDGNGGIGDNINKGPGNDVPPYGRKSVPIGPYREVNGYPVKVKPGAQEKHIPNTPNYKQEIASGKNKSIIYGDNKTTQELLDKFAGNGTTVTKNKERVDFGEPIGKYYDTVTGQYIETSRGMIHYGKDGAHIVPAKPSE
nr:polymorphic toxin type 50 domain-containing protein [Bacillus sp. REN3]